MFGIGMPELILILVIALLIFGPKKLPEIAKTIGKGMGELRKATDDLKDTWEAEVDAQEEEARRLKEAQQEAAAAALPAAAVPAAAEIPPPAGPPEGSPIGEEISAGPSLAYPGEEELLEPAKEEAAKEAPAPSAPSPSTPGQSAYVPEYPAEAEMVQANPEVIEEMVEKEERSPKTDV